MSKNFQKKKCSSLKFAIWNQKAIFNSSHFYFSLFANHKRIIPLGSQKEEIGNVSKLSKQEKCQQAIQTREMQQGCPNKQKAQNRAK